MRALIILECVVAIVLSVLIVVNRKGDVDVAPSTVFNASRLLLDAVPNESATYRLDDGRTTVTYRVLATDLTGQGAPRVSIGRTRTENGVVEPDPSPNYVHYMHRHGFFPFLTPEEPTAYDRVWILRRIQRSTLSFQGRTIPCWKVECTDPGLPPDRDAVLAWLHEDAPVFGLLRWERNGETYELTGWRPK